MWGARSSRAIRAAWREGGRERPEFDNEEWELMGRRVDHDDPRHDWRRGLRHQARVGLRHRTSWVGSGLWPARVLGEAGLIHQHGLSIAKVR